MDHRRVEVGDPPVEGDLSAGLAAGMKIVQVARGQELVGHRDTEATDDADGKRVGLWDRSLAAEGRRVRVPGGARRARPHGFTGAPTSTCPATDDEHRHL